MAGKGVLFHQRKLHIDFIPPCSYILTNPLPFPGESLWMFI